MDLAGDGWTVRVNVRQTAVIVAAALVTVTPLVSAAEDADSAPGAIGGAVAMAQLSTDVENCPACEADLPNG